MFPLCNVLHLTKEADIATAWNLPLESADDPTAMKLQQKRPLQLTNVCVCQANTVSFQHVNVGDTCDMMSVRLSGKKALDDLQGKIVVLDDDDNGDDVQVRWTSHHNNKL